MAEQKKTELELVAGLFRNTDKNGNVYYTGKSESGDEYVMFETLIGRKVQVNLTLE